MKGFIKDEIPSRWDENQMTHDELLAKIKGSSPHWLALRAVVELHEPAIVIYPKEMQILMCMECGDEEGLRYPCPTIQAIEKELK